MTPAQNRSTFLEDYSEERGSDMNVKKNPQTGKFTFDEWMHLAQNNPEQFELERKKVIDSVIEQCPEAQQLKLKQIQFRIDGIRRKYKKNGLVCAQVLCAEMEYAFHEFNDTLQQLVKKPDPPKPTLVVVKR